MALQLQITLPVDWASDFDRVAERWYFFHRPSGFCQYLLPKIGDEITRAAELVPRLPPRPVHSPVTTMVEALSIVQEKQHSTVNTVMVQQINSPSQTSIETPMTQTQVSSPHQPQQVPLRADDVSQQTSNPMTPTGTFGRRASGAVPRKPLVRKALPGQNNIPPLAQQSQAPFLQRQHSQISPRGSVSLHSIQETTVQQVQPQHMMSPRSSISQNSITESPLEHINTQPIPTNPSTQGQQPQSTNISMPLQEPAHPQDITATAQNQAPNPIQAPAPEYGSQSAPVDNPAVFWSEGFTESPRSPTQSQTWSSRPKLANRLSTSAIKMPKKAFEASKDYIKAHPGRTTAIAGGIVGGIGVAAEFCGVDGISDAVAASKIYLNVKRAQQRKRVSSVPLATSHEPTPGAAQAEAPVPPAAGPSAKDVAHELFKMMQQQGQLPSQNPPPQNNIAQYTNQGGTANQGLSQQYFPPQFIQPQFIIPQQQTPMQPDTPNPNPPFVPPLQPNQAQTPPSPTTTDYQSLPSPTQYPTPPASFSDPTSPLTFDPSTIIPDPSTLQYSQLLQDQTAAVIANQAILGSQAFTTSLTGQDMFVPGDVGDDDCVPSFVAGDSVVWTSVDESASDGVVDYDSC